MLILGPWLISHLLVSNLVVSFDDLGRLFVALGNRNEVRAFDLDLGIELVRYKIDTEAENIVFRNGSIYVGGSESITRIRLHR